MDTTPSFPDAAMDFITSRTPESLDVLHALIRADAGFSLDASPGEEVAEWRSTADHRAIVDHLTRRMPAFFLSPSAHAMLSTSLRALGETERAENQLNLAGISLRVIMESGEGTVEHPWHVLRTADQFDTLELIEKQSTSHTTHPFPGGSLDEHTSADGFVAYFRMETEFS